MLLKKFEITPNTYSIHIAVTADILSLYLCISEMN